MRVGGMHRAATYARSARICTIEMTTLLLTASRARSSPGISVAAIAATPAARCTTVDWRSRTPACETRDMRLAAALET